MHRKINKYFYAAFMLSILMGGLFFSSCENDDKEDLTTVKLNVYGPSPALRGGELKFIGMNLDKVTSVILSDNVTVSTFVSKNANEIIITIPQETKPGKVTLRTPQGDIVSQTPLTFSEPISIGSFAPASVKPGDTFTINGDYLNNIAQVIFYDGVVVDSAAFVSQTRKKIEVKIPKEAKSGVFSLSNGAEIPILVFPETSLDVKIPSASAVTPYSNVRPGETITITGTDLDLIKTLSIPGDNGSTAFTVNTAKTTITATLPSNVKDGTIILTTYSGIAINVTTNLVVASPGITSITPNPVKNGSEMTIKGTNLDLIQDITFANVSSAVTVFNSKTATEIKVTVPETAQTGTLTLNAASGKTASGAYTLVQPSVSSTSTPIVGGQSLTLNGSDLDLVSAVTFEGSNETINISAQTESSLSFVIPNTILGPSKIIIQCKNGLSLDAISVNVSPTSLAYITVMPLGGDQGATLTIMGGNFDKISSITLAGKTLTWSIAGASTMFIIIPKDCTPGQQQLVLTTPGGQTSYSLNVIGKAPTITDIWTGNVDTGGWSGWIQITDASKFANVVVGDKILVTVDPASINGSSQGTFRNGSWAGIAPGMEYFNISGDFSLDVTVDVLPQLKTSGVIIGGQKYIATKVSIVHPN